MKATPIFRYLLPLILLFFSIFNLKAQSITGPYKTCVGQTTSYHYLLPGGGTYVWELSGLPLPGIIYGTGPTIDIYWVKSGSWTLTLYQDVGGTLTYVTATTIIVSTLPKPYVTTNFRVACQSFDTVKLGNTYDPFILSDSNNCIDVCDSNIVIYTVKGGGTGDHYWWDVNGGTVISSSGTSISVLWHNPSGGGTLTVVDTNDGGCFTTLHFCINIIAKPVSLFTVNDRIVAYDTITVCKHSTVLFHDQSSASTGSLITGWQWDFGDGTSSTLKNPVHKYDTSGTYDAILTVTNACGCTSKFKVTITVSTGPAPRIECPTVVCQLDSVRYTTPDTCSGGHYKWSCSPGGTALTTDTLPYYIIRWDTVNSDGFGTVSLSVTGCTSICTGTTTAKVPVVQIHPRIQGPSLVCTGTPYQFSIPLWPGTRYNWGVIDFPGSVISGRHSNTVAVQFNAGGTYVIHVADQNSLRTCGSDVKDTIIVQAPPTIIGPTNACSGTHTYSLSTPGLTANWYLNLPGAPGHYDSSINTATFTPYLGAGTYVLSIKPPTGSPLFCVPPPIVINIGYVPGVDDIMGDTLVCLGKPYQYKAQNYLSGYSYNWSVTGGTASGTAGDSISVVWSSSTGSISAYRVMEDTPYCSSAAFTKGIHKKQLDTCHILGASTVCQSSYGEYNFSLAVDNDTKFDWSLPDPKFGTIYWVKEGKIQIFWGTGFTAPDTILLTCKAKACDTSITFTKSIIINAPPSMTLTATPDTICRGGGVVLLHGPSTSASLYNWSFGDGNYDSSVTDTISHRYGPGTDNIVASVTVPITDYACPVSGIAFLTIYRDNPKASIYSTDPLSYCNGATISTTFQSAAFGSPLAYHWYKAGTGGTISTSATYTATALGTYFLVYNDISACPDTTNSLSITKQACSGSPCANNIGLTLSGNCNVISASGSGSGTSPQWTATGGSITTITSTSIDVTYPVPGYYSIRFSEMFGTCRADTALNDTVFVIPDFKMARTCETGSYSFGINATDISSVLSGTTIDSIRWYVYDIFGYYVTTGTGSNPSLTGLTPAGTDSVIEIVYAGSHNCTTYKIISFPDQLSPSFTLSAVNACEATEIPFLSNPYEPRQCSVSWLFEDGFKTNLFKFYKSFKFDPAFVAFPNVDKFDDTLILTDTVGCTYIVTGHAYIYENTMYDTLTALSTLACPGESITIDIGVGGAHSPYDVLWSDKTKDITHDIVTASGGYSAWVEDAVGCLYKTNAVYVTILTPPDLSIIGRTNYCEGERVRLSNHHFPHYHYQWYRDTTAIDTSAIIHDPVGAGTYVYWIEATDSMHSCAPDTSAPDTVYVHPLPLKPTIDSVIAMDCPSYLLRISVTDTIGYKYTYNWSNGSIGSSIQINNGGAYRVWRTDTFGCISYADTLIPYSPESWLAWFPTGCYWFCDQSAPDTIFGPPAYFNGWQWIPNPGSVITGVGLVSPYSIVWSPGSTDLQLQLDNGLCTRTSDTMHIDAFKDCSIGCPNIFPNSITIVCDTFNPAGYRSLAPINLNNPSGTDTIFATIALHIGTAVPFNIAIPPGGGSYMLYFTTLTNPPPSSTLLTGIFNFNAAPNGCYDTLRVSIPYPCGWSTERTVGPSEPKGEEPKNLHKETISRMMLVYPNPAHDLVNVNYSFGVACTCERSISFYDITGRQIQKNTVKGITGMVNFPTKELIPGSYIIRMEENGAGVVVARLDITH